MQTSPAVEQNKNIKWFESPWNQSGRKGKGLWRKWFAKDPSLKFRVKDWTSKRRCKCDREDGEEDDDELPCVIGESEGDCVWRGSQRSVGSSFHRQGAAYWKERLVIFKEDRVGGWARVTVDEERVLRQGWTEIKLSYCTATHSEHQFIMSILTSVTIYHSFTVSLPA